MAQVVKDAMRIGRIVHACDGKACAPLMVNVVVDQHTVSGVVFAQQAIAVLGIVHSPTPTAGLIVVVGQTPGDPTWHWPTECPWNR